MLKSRSVIRERGLKAIVESIKDYILGLDYIWRCVMTAVISMVPVIELRGAIPIAAAAGLPWHTAFTVAVIGNIIPVPFIVLFIRAIFEWMKKHIKILHSLVERMERKAERNKSKIEKYEMLGLFIFVAVPLPGTGAWTGALVAGMMGMRLKRACWPIILGVVSAGIIVTILSYSVKAVVTGT